MDRARSSSVQQQQQQKSIQVSATRCVLCGGPFRCPTPYDRVASCLSGPPASFRWLTVWCSMPANQEKRKRGEPPAFYAHKDCWKLLQRKLGVQPQHSIIWPHVQTHACKDSMPDGLPESSYLGIASLLEPFGHRAATTMLSSSFKAADSWMLHSPLMCTKNASRLLTIWHVLDSKQHNLSRHLSSLLLQHSTSGKVSSLPSVRLEYSAL